MIHDCSICKIGKETKSTRLPNGWRAHPQTKLPVCSPCWKKLYMPRTITLPIAGPLNGECWPELRTSLLTAWSAATRLSNWAARQLLKNDAEPISTMDRCPKMNPIYLYGMFNEGYADRAEWDGMAASAQCVLRAVESDYREKRIDAVWRSNRNVDTYRWPQPYPVHNQNWSIARNEHGVITVDLPLVGSRWTLRVRNDASISARCRGMLNACFDGSAVLGEAKLYSRTVGPNDDRNGIYLRNPAGGESRMYRVLIGIPGWFPRGQFADEREGELHLHTGNDSFLYAEQEGYDIWTINGDAMRQRIFAYARFRHRLAEDTKQERRVPKRRKRQILDAGERRAIKENDRAKSFREEKTTHVAELARRRKVEQVIYHGGDAGFMLSFPWFMWVKRLQDKLEERGIGFVDASGEVVEEPVTA